MLTACGGSGDGPPDFLLNAPPEAEPQLLSRVKEVIDARLEAAGIEGSASVKGLTITVSVDSPELVPGGLLTEPARLDFREPVLGPDRQVTCLTEAGGALYVHPMAITHTVENDGPHAVCVGPEGRYGEVLWQTAEGRDPAGALRGLTGEDIRREDVEFRNAQGPGPVVELPFNGEGTAIFADITERLVGYPLAIFLDAQLLSAPTVQAVISEGNVIITGLTEDEARLLAAQLRGGELPGELTLVAGAE